jgi:hypothetical protein
MHRMKYAAVRSKCPFYCVAATGRPENPGTRSCRDDTLLSA